MSSCKGVTLRLVFLFTICGCRPGVESLLGEAYDRYTGRDAQPVAGLRYAAHRFIQTGVPIAFEEIGEFLELVSLTDGGLTLTEDSTGVIATGGGTACARFRYRDEVSFENFVQTQCFIAIDEVGLSGSNPIELDLESLLVGGSGGEANYLSHGENRFYGIGQSQDRVVLSPNRRSLPRPMFRIVDAFAENAFAAMGANEIEWLRRTRLTTYTGRLLAPSWLVLVGGPLRDFSLSADGSVDVRFPDCGEPVIEGIECTDVANIIEPGDILVVSPEGPPNDVLRSLITTDPARVDSFAAAHQITQWSLTDSLSTPLEIQENVLLRLSTLQLMDGYIRFFDEMYGTRAKGVPVAIRPGFVTPIGGLFCVPDDRPACQTIEDEVHAAEGRMVESWREDGFDPWISYFLRYDESGNGLPLSDQAPAIAHFDGIVIDVNTNASPPGPPGLITEALPNAIAGVAQEVGSMPVIVSPWAGPMDFYTVGGFCEGEICLSAFEDYYTMNEALFDQALASFPIDQIESFVIPLVDGGHFDIRDPQEGGVNRVGETGFNNPLLNIYLTQ